MIEIRQRHSCRSLSGATSAYFFQIVFRRSEVELLLRLERAKANTAPHRRALSRSAYRVLLAFPLAEPHRNRAARIATPAEEHRFEPARAVDVPTHRASSPRARIQ